MTRKRSEVVRLAEVQAQINFYSFLTKILLDPLWSSIIGMATTTSLRKVDLISGTEHKLLIYGIIDMNMARTNIETTAALQIINATKETMSSVAKGAALMAVAKSHPVAAGAMALTDMTVGEALAKGRIMPGSP